MTNSRLAKVVTFGPKALNSQALRSLTKVMLMNKMTGTHLGNFLKTLRQSRGYSNVNEYLRKYQLQISYVYYRDIEMGKRQIGLESAKSLCESLKVSYLEFYSHLLKDLLPSEILDDFVPLIRPQDEDHSTNGGSKSGLKSLLEESKRSLSQKHNTKLKDPTIYHGITALTAETYQKVLNRIADFLSEIGQDSQAEATASADSRPYYYSLVLSKRSQYRPK